MEEGRRAARQGSEDDVSLMRSEHVLSPRIEGLLSTQPTMEPVQGIEAVIKKHTQEQLVKMFETVFAIRGQFIYFFIFYFYFSTLFSTFSEWKSHF